MINTEKIKELTYQFLLAIGEDPNREGLMETPKRVAEMCDELFNPSHANAKYTTFSSGNFGNIDMSCFMVWWNGGKMAELLTKLRFKRLWKNIKRYRKSPLLQAF